MNFANMKGLLSSHLKKRVIILATSLIALLTLTGLGYFIFEGTKKTVAVTLNGETSEVRTHAETVEDLVAELGINFREVDDLSPDLDTKITNDMQIVWKQAKEVVLKIDGIEEKIWTTADTVEEFLKEQNIVISEKDKINVDLNEKIVSNLTIDVNVSFELVLKDAGKEKTFWTTSTTVADFLEQQGITLNKLDRVEPNLSELVKKDSKITITRVEKVTDVVEEEINYAVVTKKDSSLENGKEKVVQNGKKGKLQKKYEVILENGVVVSKKLISEEVIAEPTDKVVALGTKKVETTVYRGYEVVDEFYVEATAYTAYCTGCTGKTATGLDLRKNPHLKVIAVDPKVIPYGTKVWVEGYGYAVAADTGGGMKGNRIDVFFPDKKTAYQWGRKRVKIRILK